MYISHILGYIETFVSFLFLLSKMMCQNGCCCVIRHSRYTAKAQHNCTLLSCVTMAAKGPSTLTNAPINLLALREDGKRELLALLDEVMQCVVVLFLWQTQSIHSKLTRVPFPSTTETDAWPCMCGAWARHHGSSAAHHYRGLQNSQGMYIDDAGV